MTQRKHFVKGDAIRGDSASEAVNPESTDPARKTIFVETPGNLDEQSLEKIRKTFNDTK